jgi:hypothetical protein
MVAAISIKASTTHAVGGDGLERLRHVGHAEVLQDARRDEPFMEPARRLGGGFSAADEGAELTHGLLHAHAPVAVALLVLLEEEARQPRARVANARDRHAPAARAPTATAAAAAAAAAAPTPASTPAHCARQRAACRGLVRGERRRHLRVQNLQRGDGSIQAVRPHDDAAARAVVCWASAASVELG